MQYQHTAEIGVLIPAQTQLWLPAGRPPLTRAPAPFLKQLLRAMGEWIGQLQPDGRVLLTAGAEISERQGSLWHTTDWTDSPTTAALLATDARHILHTLWLSLNQPEDLYLVTGGIDGPAVGLAPIDETYRADADADAKTPIAALLADDDFAHRVLLPYLAVRRLTVRTLAFRPDSPRAAALARNHVGHLTRIKCNGCRYPCRAVLRTDEGPTMTSLTINLGDNYLFGRLSAASTAQTSLLLLAGAEGHFDETDASLADPLGAVQGFASAPVTYRARMRNGESLSGVDILNRLMPGLHTFLSQTSRRDDLEAIVAAELASGGWLPTKRADPPPQARSLR